MQNPQETLVVLVEIERKVQEIREITGKPPGDEWLVSILLTVMDKDTKTNVSSTMTTDATFPHLRDKVRAYATLMGGSPGKGPAPMDIDQIRETARLIRRPDGGGAGYQVRSLDDPFKGQFGTTRQWTPHQKNEKERRRYRRRTSAPIS